MFLYDFFSSQINSTKKHIQYHAYMNFYKKDGHKALKEIQIPHVAIYGPIDTILENLHTEH